MTRGMPEDSTDQVSHQKKVQRKDLFGQRDLVWGENIEGEKDSRKAGGWAKKEK